MFRIKVPATTANMGPGFDALGMALNLYNEVEIEEIESGVKVIWDCPQENELPLEDNLIYTSMVFVLDRYKHSYKGFRIRMKGCCIPMSRGLGSSASSIVAGIYAANAIMGDVLDEEDMINIATELEGHPDNVVPAITGGMVVSLCEGSQVVYSRIDVPENLKFAVMIPSFKVSTEKARGVMPKTYEKSDCIFNISRVAMLVNAFNKGETEKLRLCTQDMVHQPYRKALISGIDDIFQKSRELGAVAEFISGSGSTLISIVENQNKNFENEMKKFIEKLEGGWEIKMLETDAEGVKTSL